MGPSGGTAIPFFRERMHDSAEVVSVKFSKWWGHFYTGMFFCSAERRFPVPA
jgi:hypothetical protein